MPASARILAVAVTTAACLGGTALPASAAPQSDAVGCRRVTIPDFYTPPATLPAAYGALVRSEPLPLALSLPGVDGPLPGAATRLMYKSTDSNGEPMAVTGAYIEPAAAWSYFAMKVTARPLLQAISLAACLTTAWVSAAVNASA